MLEMETDGFPFLVDWTSALDSSCVWAERLRREACGVFEQESSSVWATWRVCVWPREKPVVGENWTFFFFAGAKVKDYNGAELEESNV